MSTNIKSIEDTDNIRVIHVEGEITHVRSPEFRQNILRHVQQGPAKMIVSLSGVTYMDSSGVAILVEVLKAVQDKHMELVVCEMNPRVRGIFEISRLISVFNIEDTLESALNA